MIAIVEISIRHFRGNNVLHINNSLHDAFEIIADNFQKCLFLLFYETKRPKLLCELSA